jgi:hypothetical protein
MSERSERNPGNPTNKIHPRTREDFEFKRFKKVYKFKKLRNKRFISGRVLMFFIDPTIFILLPEIEHTSENS